MQVLPFVIFFSSCAPRSSPNFLCYVLIRHLLLLLHRCVCVCVCDEPAIMHILVTTWDFAQKKQVGWSLSGNGEKKVAGKGKTKITTCRNIAICLASSFSEMLWQTDQISRTCRKNPTNAQHTLNRTYCDSLLGHILWGGRTVLKRLVTHYVPIVVLATCWTTGPCIICPHTIICHAMFGLCGALKFVCAVCACWSGKGKENLEEKKSVSTSTFVAVIA